MDQFSILNNMRHQNGYLVVSSVKSSFFTTKDIEQDLRKLVLSENQKDDDDVNVDLLLASKGINTADFAHSLACCNALIAYLQLLLDDVQNSFTIEQYNLSSYMKLDSSTTVSYTHLDVYKRQM